MKINTNIFTNTNKNKNTVLVWTCDLSAFNQPVAGSVEIKSKQEVEIQCFSWTQVPSPILTSALLRPALPISCTNVFL